MSVRGCCTVSLLYFICTVPTDLLDVLYTDDGYYHYQISTTVLCTVPPVGGIHWPLRQRRHCELLCAYVQLTNQTVT